MTTKARKSLNDNKGLYGVLGSLLLMSVSLCKLTPRLLSLKPRKNSPGAQTAAPAAPPQEKPEKPGTKLPRRRQEPAKAPTQPASPTAEASKTADRPPETVGENRLKLSLNRLKLPLHSLKQPLSQLEQRLSKLKLPLSRRKHRRRSKQPARGSTRD